MSENNSKRSFATVATLGAQSLGDRFGKRSRRGDYDDLPQLAPWRCNLTGLSQTCNHYFVAYQDEIHVFAPDFPTQTLSQTPVLIVKSAQSSPGLSGYIDDNNPHAVNNLVVQYLGKEEMVAAVRDDGDIDAYLVRHIVQAIEKRAESGSTLGLEALELRPFFHANVGKSAWGLAIHSQQRIIATSANTHQITFFKFGLVASQDYDGSAPPQDREMDVAHSVLNGRSNIPSIAFCNTGDDPEARWLLTTDVTGICRSIDIIEMHTTQTFRFGRSPGVGLDSPFDRFNAGWAIMFLDSRSFVESGNVHEALGLGEGESLPDTDSKLIWDIGATVAHVPGSSVAFSPPNRRNRRSTRNIRNQSSSARGSEVGGTRSTSEVSMTDDESMLEDIEALPEDDQINGDDGEDTDESETDYESAFEDVIDVDDEGTEDTSSFSAMYGGRRICGNRPTVLQPLNSLAGSLPCPILHASVRSVYLLQPSSLRQHHSMTMPTVGFTNALRQMVHGSYGFLNHFERLNMTAYIPSLGVVVLASQKGRAMVVSLTKLPNNIGLPRNMVNREYPTSKTTYAMKIERTLPFADQEAEGRRPPAPLAGIATGPMQGSEHLPDDERRWRLLMMYHDHTVLSYEIKRERARDSSVDIKGMVV